MAVNARASATSTTLSMRAFVAALEEAGELVTVDREVDWDLEMGAIARLAYETGAPAPLFTDVKDARPGFRAIGAPMGVSRRPGRELARIALALGLAPSATSREIIAALVAARNRPAIPPTVVDSAPCQQHVWRGDEIDLQQLPIPLLHAGDGGRYLNTLGVIVSRTPDRRWTSWAVARIMLLDARRASYAVVPFQHTGKIFKEWRERGEDMPIALAFGVPPIALYAAGMPLPERMDEAGYAGAFAGQSIDVVRCESVGLEVPAESEIVLEGHVSLQEHGLEGPYGDYMGYVTPHGPAPAPVFTVDVVTHRDEPIYPFSCSGEPPDETHTVWGLATAAEATHLLRDAGLPVVTGWFPFAAANGWFVVTVPDGWRSSVPDAEELCRRIGDIVFASKARITINTIIVVEDDIDPANIRELVWAVDGRRNGTLTFAGKVGFAFSPYTRDLGDFPKGWEATGEVWNLLPPEGITRPPRTRFEDNYPASIKERVRSAWAEDGFADA
jgi:4-hydroxy-3-polyprenylbenzoate decarboxylase